MSLAVGGASAATAIGGSSVRDVGIATPWNPVGGFSTQAECQVARSNFARYYKVTQCYYHYPGWEFAYCPRGETCTPIGGRKESEAHL